MDNKYIGLASDSSDIFNSKQLYYSISKGCKSTLGIEIYIDATVASGYYAQFIKILIQIYGHYI